MQPDENPRARLGLWSGVGVNVGTMIGVGVFISAGFMAGSMGPGQILLAWLVGGLLAMAGARAYGALAAIVPHSGGEYRYLSELLHPWLGSLAGWTSLLAGFAAPVAANCLGITAFAGTLGVRYAHLGAFVIVATTLVHAFDLGVSKEVQDGLAFVKVVLVAGFIAIGLAFGSYALPSWTPAHAPAGGGLRNFMVQLAFVMYAYSGWNSAIYAADEFRDPERTVPRSMVISAVAVMGIYLAVNWVFVANLSPDLVSTFLEGDPGKVTFGHLVTTRLIGAAGGKVMSVLVIVALASAASAMTLVGPRVYQAMARDGFLPRVFAGGDDRPPLFSVFLQGGLSLVIYYVQELKASIENIGVILTAIAALTVAALFRVPRRAGPVALACAAVFILLSVWMVVFQAAGRSGLNLLVWTVVLLVATTASYAVARWSGRPSQV